MKTRLFMLIAALVLVITPMTVLAQDVGDSSNGSIFGDSSGECSWVFDYLSQLQTAMSEVSMDSGVAISIPGMQGSSIGSGDQGLYASLADYFTEAASQLRTEIDPPIGAIRLNLSLIAGSLMLADFFRDADEYGLLTAISDSSGNLGDALAEVRAGFDEVFAVCPISRLIFGDGLDLNGILGGSDESGAIIVFPAATPETGVVESTEVATEVPTAVATGTPTQTPTISADAPVDAEPSATATP